MLKFKKVLTPLAISLAIAFSANTFAGHGAHVADKGMRQILQQLDLSNSQRHDIRQLIKQTRGERGVYRQDMRDLREDIRELVQAPQWDEQAARTALSEGQDLLGTLALQKATSKHQVWQRLSAEQQAEFALLAEQREPKERGSKGAFRKLKGLNLSDEQSAAIKLLETDLQASRDGFNTKRQAFKQAQRVFIQSEAFSQSDWQFLSAQYQQDFLTMALEKAQSKHHIWQILTPEQQTQLKEKMAKHAAKKRHGKKHGARKSRTATG